MAIAPGDFVHLHLHSEYSLLDGALRIADIPRLAKEMGHTHVALTDHGNMFGAVAFYQACMAEGIRPIIGCEVYLAPKSRFLKAKDENGAYYHLILLCENETGYRNLCKMVSLSYLEGFYTKPRIDLELLQQYHEGLIALSACLGGWIPSCITRGDFAAAREHAAQMLQIMGEGNYYFELQDHFLSEQQDVNQTLLKMSEEMHIPLVATNDVHYGRRQDAQAQAALVCIQTNTTLADESPMGFETEEYYYKSTEEMERLFAAYPQALTNTGEIARRCCFDFTFGKTLLPTYPVPDGLSAEAYLRQLAQQGFAKREAAGEMDFAAHSRQEYADRVAYELKVICEMGFAQYYLIVWDFISWARGQGIPVGPGRGSGAGSLVAYLLEITQVDSLKYGLMFERFLNPERVSMPDFDVDFCYERRGEVIDYVCRRYGSDHVAQIITFGTLAARAAVRDVGRVLGMPYAAVDAIAKLIPRELNITLEKALQTAALREVYESDEQARRLLDIARSLEGMPRHASTHAAGVVITPEPVMSYVPLAENSGVAVTQYDMDTIAQLGLLKIDFLGLRYLTVISDTEKMIRREKPDFSVEKVSLTDEATYRMIEKGNTAGVFQLESAGMRRVLSGMRPRDLEGIVAAIALYRPGPMESIPTFIQNRQAPEQIVYDPPVLRDILSVTYGCIVYQEQVMQICREVAGYSLGRADIVRRAMAKKKTAVMAQEREYFIHGLRDETGTVLCEGAVARGISEQTAAHLFDQMASFAKYAFNKSHAVAYAYISYRTAYLKCHYPAQYLCALLTSVLGSTEKMAEYIADAAAMGIALLAPDINESGRFFTVSQTNGRPAIRFGLCAIKNVGETFVQKVLAERREAPFDSFEDFVRRMSTAELNKRQVEALIKAGAFDGMRHKRAQLMASYEVIIDKYMQQSRSILSGQIDLFSLESAEQGETRPKTMAYEYPDIPEMSLRQKLLQEREVTGQCFSGHLLDEYSLHIAALRPASVLEICRSFAEEDMQEEAYRPFADKQRVTVCGVLVALTLKQTRKEETMAFATLEDRYGQIELVIFPATLRACRQYLQQDVAVCAVGEISVREEEAPKLLIREITPLYNNVDFQRNKQNTVSRPAAEVRKPQTLYLRLPDLNPDRVEYQKVCNLLAIFEGSTPVVLYDASSRKYRTDIRLGCRATDFVLQLLAQELGEKNVILK